MRTLTLALLIACSPKERPAAPPDAAPAPPPTKAEAPPATDAAPARLQSRPGGPTVEACQKAAEHLASLMVDSAVGATNAQRAYVETMLSREKGTTVQICLQIAVPAEVACMVVAKDVGTLAACERFRREVPKELTSHTEPTQADCERMFDRLRQFKIQEGTDPDEVDATRDQVVRACQEKAKVGTIACFLASPTYAQARKCP
jgi:hypothetical protein